MIKILNCRKKNYHFELSKFLSKRQLGTKIKTKIVRSIIGDVKKNGGGKN